MLSTRCRAHSSRLFFLDCSDQLVAAAEQFPCILAETPLLSDGGLGAKRFRKSREIGYELVVVDERAFQRWGARRRSVVDIDVEAGDAGVIAGVCHGRDLRATSASSSRSRFFVNTVGTQTRSSTPRPTN